jgi:hypothetical protein
LRLKGSPNPRHRGLAIREPSDRFYSWQAIPDLDQTLHWPRASQLLQLPLACEASATGIGICRPWFVTRSDVTFRCEMKKHRFNPRFRYSVAALPITSITPLPQKSKSKCQPKNSSDCLDSLLQATGLRRHTSAYDLACSNTPK